jgi:serine protease AprX
MIERINSGTFKSSMGSTQKNSPADNLQDRSAVDEIRDTFGFGQLSLEDLTPQGKVPVIIKAEDKKAAQKMKGFISRKMDPEQAKVSEDLPLVNSLVVEVEPKSLKDLVKVLPRNSQVVLDSKIRFPQPEKMIPVIPNPEMVPRPFLDTLGMNRLWDMGLTGKGIGICVIDSGIHPHKDFEGRITAFVDMTNEKKKPYDPDGHGTHVAGIAAGSGEASAGRCMGMAPEADIMGIRIASVSDAIKGIQWAIEHQKEHNIKVLNISLGDMPVKSYKDDPWAQAAEKAWEHGIVVVAAAGNEGPGKGTVNTPGIDPKVITVGAMDDRGTPSRNDDIVAKFSSRGPTVPDHISKPDLVAPGVEIYGALAPGSMLDTPDRNHLGNEYIAVSGSSMATPMVSGLVALLMQANPELSNDDIKTILMKTAEPYIPKAGKNDQGAGLVDPWKALQKAIGKNEAQLMAMKFGEKEAEPQKMNIAGDHKKNRSRKATA